MFDDLAGRSRPHAPTGVRTPRGGSLVRQRALVLAAGALASIAGAATLQIAFAQEPEGAAEPEARPTAEPGSTPTGASEEEGAGSDEGADAELAPPSDPTVPMTLWIGVYPLHVGDLDLRRGTANVTYYAWSRWAGASNGTAYELVNGNVESREAEYRDVMEGGVNYAYFRYRAEVQLDLDFHDFPFDEHYLSVEFEHAEESGDSVVLRVDEDSVRHIESPPVAGWLVEPPVYDVIDHAYHTNWGDPSVSPDEVTNYPRYRMRIRLHHSDSATFFKTFLTLFISVLIAFLAFFLHPSELEARVGLGVAGIFGSVTSQSVVASNLPEIPYMTLSDKIHLAGMVCVFIALLETSIAGWLVQKQRSGTAINIDRVSRVVMPLGYALVVVAFIQSW